MLDTGGRQEPVKRCEDRSRVVRAVREVDDFGSQTAEKGTALILMS